MDELFDSTNTNNYGAMSDRRWRELEENDCQSSERGRHKEGKNASFMNDLTFTTKLLFCRRLHCLTQVAQFTNQQLLGLRLSTRDQVLNDAKSSNRSTILINKRFSLHRNQFFCCLIIFGVSITDNDSSISQEPQSQPHKVKDSIDRHYEFLVDRMFPDFVLNEKLNEDLCITSTQINAIKKKETARKKNELIIKYLIENQREEKLFEALDKSDQKHLVKYLENDGSKILKCCNQFFKVYVPISFCQECNTSDA